MRDLHEQMLAAVLDGDGLEGIAELASAELGIPVAILLPNRGLSVVWPEPDDTNFSAALTEWAAAALTGSNGALPDGVEQTAPVIASGTDVGRIAALSPTDEATRAPLIDVGEVLRWAALATLSEIAVIEARDQLAEQLRGGFIEDLRSTALDAAEVIRRGKRLGCELEGGLIAIAAEANNGKPRYMAAIISSTATGVLAEPIGQRVYALLPAGGTDDEQTSRAQAAAREIVRRVSPHGSAAASSPYLDPGEAGRALREAEMMLDVVRGDPELAEQLAGSNPSGVYRLLFRALASNPEEVRSFYDDTVRALVEHDREYHTDLLRTLEEYLGNDCNMRATAEAVYAHRHTVSHRLERIKELCGLDPASGEDRERLGLGIKAFRLIEPRASR